MQPLADWTRCVDALCRAHLGCGWKDLSGDPPVLVALLHLFRNQSASSPQYRLGEDGRTAHEVPSPEYDTVTSKDPIFMKVIDSMATPSTTAAVPRSFRFWRNSTFPVGVPSAGL